MRVFCSHPVLLVALAALAAAQTTPPPAPKSEPDVLVFTNGEKLIGKLVRSNGGSVTFHSDSVGDITVDWAKVKEMKTAGVFAVVGKGTDLKRADMDAIPRGSITVENQKLEVAKRTGGTTTVPIPDAAQIIEGAAFERALTHTPGLFEQWKGSVTAGASLVESTQASRTFTGGLNLVRALPAESFFERSSRTSIDFNGAFGSTRQPGVPNVKTEIYHAGAEQDKYFSPRAFGFAQASFDHNFSQGLDLQESFGGGIGLTAIKQANQELNLKASVDYSRQLFSGAPSQDLFGSIFTDTYTRKLGKAHNMVFQQQLQISPAWNNLDAYSAIGSASFSAPVFKQLSFVIGITDGFVNNPPPGFKKNSFQATTGLTYVLK